MRGSCTFIIVDVHEAGIAGAVPLVAGVVGMAYAAWTPTGEVESSCAAAQIGSKSGLAEAAPADRRGADKDDAASKPGHPRHLARGQRGSRASKYARPETIDPCVRPPARRSRCCTRGRVRRPVEGRRPSFPTKVPSVG